MYSHLNYSQKSFTQKRTVNLFILHDSSGCPFLHHVNIIAFSKGGGVCLFFCLFVFFTVRNSSCGKVMFSQVSVCPWGRCTPPGRHPPLADTPPPPSRRLLQQTVRILLECILVCSVLLFFLAKLPYSCLVNESDLVDWRPRT